MNIVLDAVEVRVLGSLVEKEISTPEYYPLSLHALVNACNQKSNRDPAMNLDEDAVKRAMRSLQDKELAGAADTTDSRVTKYEHRLAEAFNFSRPETAILCVLLLRGPQTPGELRGRAERMYGFDDLNGVQSTLQHLMHRDPPLVKMLPRQPGTKEARYAHLLSGNPPEDVSGPVERSAPAPPRETGAAATGIQTANDDGRIGRIEEETTLLRREIADLKAQFAAFRKQFE